MSGFAFHRYANLRPEDLDPGRQPACPCWPLVVLVYREGLGVELPRHDTVPRDASSIALAAAVEAAHAWVPVPLGMEVPFDVVLIDEDGLRSHCGVVAEPGLLLHAPRGGLSCILPYDRRTGRPLRRPLVYRLAHHGELPSPHVRDAGRDGVLPGR